MLFFESAETQKCVCVLCYVRLLFKFKFMPCVCKHRCCVFGITFHCGECFVSNWSLLR